MYFDLWTQDNQEEQYHDEQQFSMIELRQRYSKSSLGGYSRVNSEEEELNNIPQLNTSLISSSKSKTIITKPTNCKIFLNNVVSLLLLKMIMIMMFIKNKYMYE